MMKSKGKYMTLMYKSKGKLFEVCHKMRVNNSIFCIKKGVILKKMPSGFNKTIRTASFRFGTFEAP